MVAVRHLRTRPVPRRRRSPLRRRSPRPRCRTRRTLAGHPVGAESSSRTRPVTSSAWQSRKSCPPSNTRVRKAPEVHSLQRRTTATGGRPGRPSGPRRDRRGDGECHGQAPSLGGGATRVREAHQLPGRFGGRAGGPCCGKAPQPRVPLVAQPGRLPAVSPGRCCPAADPRTIHTSHDLTTTHRTACGRHASARIVAPSPRPVPVGSVNVGGTAAGCPRSRAARAEAGSPGSGGGPGLQADWAYPLRPLRERSGDGRTAPVTLRRTARGALR